MNFKVIDYSKPSCVICGQFRSKMIDCTDDCGFRQIWVCSFCANAMCEALRKEKEKENKES